MARCDTYSFGNCTRGACDDNSWVPDGLGDGGDWARDAAARGFVVTMIPTVGAVVCYCRGDGYSPYGHVGTVVQVAGPDSFQVREMNYAAFDQFDLRWSNTFDVCGFILPPGVQPGQPGGGQGAGSGGLSPGIPQEIRQAWEAVRWVTQTLSQDLAATEQWVAQVAQAVSG